MEAVAERIEISGMESNRPFPETLKSLLEMENISQRELSRRCVEESNWGSSHTINTLAKGELRPSLGAMEAIARSLRVAPETFAEYRLMVARNKLDPRQVGLKSALKALDAFERALG